MLSSRPAGGLALWGMLLAAGCGQGVGPVPVVDEHPNRHNGPPPGAVVLTTDSLPVGLSEARLAAWMEARSRLLGAEVALRLGSEGAGPELFGSVPKAAVGPSGEVFVLDEDAQEVRVFDSTGHFVGLFGGRGDGPLELRSAHDLHVFPDGRVAVALGKYGRIKMMQRLGGSWVLIELIDLRLTPAVSLCGTPDGRLFSSGTLGADTTIIHELVPGEQGRSLRSLGTTYRHPDPFVRRHLSEGSVACVGTRLVYAFRHMPTVRSYGGEGAVQWAAVVGDHIPEVVREGRHPETGATALIYGGEREFDALGFVGAVGEGDHVLLQQDRIRGDKGVPRTYLLDAATGIGGNLGDSLPHILSVHPGGYVAYFVDPYPRLEVRSVGRRPREGG